MWPAKRRPISVRCIIAWRGAAGRNGRPSRPVGTVYQDLGANYFDERDRHAVVRRKIHRLEALGYRVLIEPLNPAS